MANPRIFHTNPKQQSAFERKLQQVHERKKKKRERQNEAAITRT
jgi:hypothetical protein